MIRVADVYDRLLRHYGAQGWWPARSRFEVIVGALLMHQTAWRNVERAIGNLRAAGLLDVRRLATAPIPTIRRHVQVAGLYRVKPSRLRAFCRHLLERADGDLDAYFDRPARAVREDLLSQTGVGPETADSILLYAGGHPAFVVDAYTVRIGQRIGWFETTAYGAVQRVFTRGLPRDARLYQEFHALLVAHAKALCRPRPRCPECPLRRACAYGSRRKRYGPGLPEEPDGPRSHVRRVRDDHRRGAGRPAARRARDRG
ncbi:MAG TPA: endonuclease III domain-containing protein [Thermoplasmata archaeon]|nr:endonuclease III domain-containing protein [Thermoplasmata archaeon]